jgi:hypothetical protein
MPTPNETTIGASDINNEMRGWCCYEMSIWHARNGYYGGINDASSRRPGGPGRNTNSGYAWSDWWGYQHSGGYSPQYLYIIENGCDSDTRLRRWWWNWEYVGEWWAWASNWGDSSGNGIYTYARIGDQMEAWFDANIDWGNYWCYCYKMIYTDYRGYLLYVYELGNQGRAHYWNPIANERTYTYYYCY